MKKRPTRREIALRRCVVCWIALEDGDTFRKEDRDWLYASVARTVSCRMKETSQRCYVWQNSSMDET